MRFWLIAILVSFSVSMIIRWMVHLVNSAVNVGMDIAEKLYPCHKIGLEHHWVEYCPRGCDYDCGCGQRCNECLRVCVTCRVSDSADFARAKLTKEDWDNILVASIHQS